MVQTVNTLALRAPDNLLVPGVGGHESAQRRHNHQHQELSEIDHAHKDHSFKRLRKSTGFWHSLGLNYQPSRSQAQITPSWIS